ncbi:MAG: hypothetical protein AW07_04166 [Candidatus Accumulibacter sp. SK-11]|nr:MAG: hypothetical protein AW07_04166 [Candidatus Accumulibacter sp. SK-11]
MGSLGDLLRIGDEVVTGSINRVQPGDALTTLTTRAVATVGDPIILFLEGELQDPTAPIAVAVPRGFVAVAKAVGVGIVGLPLASGAAYPRGAGDVVIVQGELRRVAQI